MKYKELCVPLKGSGGDEADMLVAFLDDYEFESYVEGNGCMKAYIAVDDCNFEWKELEESLRQEGYKAEFNEIEEKNWNSEWESNFSPITVDGKCYVRAPFHAEDADCPMTLTIMPQMSFGTGHHSTTYLMISRMFYMEFKDRKVLDMGSGTGVLAILAAKLGAESADAIDVDEWAYENAVENIKINGVESKVTAYLGDAALLDKGAVCDKKYDVILANINRNILLRDMPAYIDHLSDGGDILFSGFLDIDLDPISERCKELGLKIKEVINRQGWLMVHAVK